MCYVKLIDCSEVRIYKRGLKKTEYGNFIFKCK